MNTSSTVISINLGLSRAVEYRNRQFSTGIYKQPVTGMVQVGTEGIEGDVQVDRKNHGGSDKALYVYTLENYRYWESQLNHSEYAYGHFGENLTVTGMPDAGIYIGDIWQIGSLITQVTQPRVPCFKLGMVMGDPGFVEAFLYSGRAGFYLRVLEGGELEAGASAACLEQGVSGLSVGEAMHAIIKGPKQKDILLQALSIPSLSESWREDLHQRLHALTHDSI
ncbi:MAG: MOSC domain-containing protein [Methylococcaceae bacterium]